MLMLLYAMKKVNFNEKKNEFFFIEKKNNKINTLKIIKKYFYKVEKRESFRKKYDFDFIQIFDKIEWIEKKYKYNSFDSLDVFSVIYEDLKKFHSFKDIKRNLIFYDFNIFNDTEFF